MKKTILRKASGILLAVCMLATMFTCLMSLHVSAADADMLSFDGTNAYGVVAYTTSWTTVPAGDYRFEMDCKITSGTPVCYPCARVWNSEESTTKFSNRSYTYDETNYKYIVTFTITSAIDGNFSMYIGNYDGALDGSGDAVFSCANPKLYDVDSLGNATQNTTLIRYDFNTYTNTKDISSSTTHKWRRLSSSGVTRSSIPDGYFDPYVEPVPEYVHFEPNRNNYSRMIYLLGYGALDAGDYRFQMDCKIFSGTPRISVGSRDSNTYPQFDKQTNYTATYDAENYKYTITFTLTEDLTGSECIGILIGNYGDDGDFVCANPTFYELDGSGEPTGDNLINTFATQFYNSSLATGKWYRAGNYTCTTLPEHYFDPESTNNYALHFPSFENNYHVVVYKDTGIYVAADSKYRLVIDVNNISADEPVIQMRTGGSSISTSYTGTLISTNGYERVYEFTVTSAATGIGLFMGPYNTDYIDVAFRKPRLYKWVNGAYGGANMVAPINSDTFDRHDWNATRANAENCRWTPVNAGSGRLQYGVDNGSYFTEAQPVETTGSPKMINFYHGFSWKSAAYNDSTLSLKGGHTYVFTINQKVSSGSPKIALYDQSNNTISSNYASSYTDNTVGNVRTITFTMARPLTYLRIRVGNYSDDTDIAASFANPCLVEQGSTDNLIAGFSSDTVSDSAGDGLWHLAGKQSGSGVVTHEALDIPDGYFGTPQKNMYYISKVTTAYQGLEYNAKLEADTTYILEFDWRTYSGAYPKVALEGYNGSEWVGLAQTARSNNTMDGSYTALTSNELPATVVYKSYGHYAVSFTTPSDLSSSGYRNVFIRFANKIINDSYYSYGRGASYYGNFKLQKSGVSGNAMLNGDLAIAKTGNVTNSDTGKFAGFVIGINKSGSGRDYYRDLCVLPQPENFFTSDGAAAQKTLKFNGGDYDYIRQKLLLEPNTQYCLTYNFTFVNAENGAYMQQVDSSNNYSGVTAEYNTNDGTQTKQLVFTTQSDLREKQFNFVMNMYIGRNAPDASFYFTNVQLRKWNGTAATGPNLINNGGFFFGDEAIADNGTEIIVPAVEVAGDRTEDSTGAIQTLGWDVYGRFNKNTNIEVINTPASFFTAYMKFETRAPMLRRMLLNLEERGYHPYEDINNDTSFDIRDYVHTKLAWLESGTSATTTVAEEFKNTYVYGDNTTHLDTMSTSLFGNGTRPTGTVYYVDADNGNDSNSGTSPSSAWKTLNKVNTASISSGSAVLFKCGCVWRAKTGECTSTDTNKGVLRCKNGVTYGSYGSGNKPIIDGSYYNYKDRTWTSAGTNIWKTSINLSGNYHGNDVGIIVYNYGSLIGKMTLKKADLANEGDFWCREPNGTDGGDGYVYVYCTQNPSTKWKSIEIGQKRNLCDLANNCTVNNICFKYGGLHGLTASNLTAVCISNCEIAYIGGAYNTSRLGNGVELGLTAANCRVKNCYVRECYDAGLTFQCWEGTGSFQSINFSNNLIENCNYSIEFFTTNVSDKIKDIYLMNNICRGAGYGWSYDEREGYGQDTSSIGCYRTSHIRVSSGTQYRYTNLSEFYITGNIFDTAKGALIYWWWNDSDNTNLLDVYDGLHISGNTLYQAARSGDDRIIQFKNESGILGSSTYSVREALKLFESTDTPTKLNESRFLLDERVISTY